MKAGKNKELRQLLKKLLDEKQAAQTLKDFEWANKILRENPAPQPDRQLLDNIKTQIRSKLDKRRASLNKRRLAFRMAAAAAAVVILAAFIANMLEKTDQNHKSPAVDVMPMEMWKNQDLNQVDPTLATISIQTENIRRELLSLQLGDDSADNQRTLVDLEVELAEIESEFWKG